MAKPRRAGVSSFGISGTNAHVILEEAPALEPVGITGAVEDRQRAIVAETEPVAEAEPVATDDRSRRKARQTVWATSRRCRGCSRRRAHRRSRAQAQRLAQALRDDTGPDVEDIGLSLASRPLLEHRAVLLGNDREALLDALAAFGRGESPSTIVRGVSSAPGLGGLAFLFTGQGAQRVGMGRELYETFAVVQGGPRSRCARRWTFIWSIPCSR